MSRNTLGCNSLNRPSSFSQHLEELEYKYFESELKREWLEYVTFDESVAYDDRIDVEKSVEYFQEKYKEHKFSKYVYQIIVKYNNKLYDLYEGEN